MSKTQLLLTNIKDVTSLRLIHSFSLDILTDINTYSYLMVCLYCKNKNNKNSLRNGNREKCVHEYLVLFMFFQLFHGTYFSTCTLSFSLLLWRSRWWIITYKMTFLHADNDSHKNNLKNVQYIRHDTVFLGQ